MDDFLYATPVPEPSSLAAAVIGLTGIITIARRRRK
ncbi:MAG: PEP-CTERM sorting domain-containing protein [Planctomycetota bacterium]|nr:PEP-CTERM sorting domain-containing protein [Planctomycetota bacterium]MDA1178001.1 PEP-CTERM sorting domain-containing protein [Planctomycetota bacterium]